MAGEDELNREIQMLEANYQKLSTMIQNRCFNRHSRNEDKFVDCIQRYTDRFSQTKRILDSKISYFFTKFTQCNQLSKEPQYCYLDIHQNMKETFTNALAELGKEEESND